MDATTGDFFRTDQACIEDGRGRPMQKTTHLNLSRRGPHDGL